MSDNTSQSGSTDESKTRLFTRAEALGGVSSIRRARALLFLIEYWAARLAWQAQGHLTAVAAAADLSTFTPVLLDESLFRDEASDVENDPDDGYYRAFGLSREGIPAATLREIEKYASEWARLVPRNNWPLRAQVARLLMEKYPLTHRGSVWTRAALGLDTDSFAEAYQVLYNESVANAYAPAPPSFAEKMRGLFRGGR